MKETVSSTPIEKLISRKVRRDKAGQSDIDRLELPKRIVTVLQRLGIMRIADVVAISATEAKQINKRYHWGRGAYEQIQAALVAVENVDIDQQVAEEWPDSAEQLSTFDVEQPVQEVVPAEATRELPATSLSFDEKLDPPISVLALQRLMQLPHVGGRMLTKIDNKLNDQFGCDKAQAHRVLDSAEIEPTSEPTTKVDTITHTSSSDGVDSGTALILSWASERPHDQWHKSSHPNWARARFYPRRHRINACIIVERRFDGRK